MDIHELRLCNGRRAWDEESTMRAKRARFLFRGERSPNGREIPCPFPPNIFKELRRSREKRSLRGAKRRGKLTVLRIWIGLLHHFVLRKDMKGAQAISEFQEALFNLKL